MRPCGVIVLLAELFRAESKSQVYANLHKFMRRHPRVLENIGMSTTVIFSMLSSLKAPFTLALQIGLGSCVNALMETALCKPHNGCGLAKLV